MSRLFDDNALAIGGTPLVRINHISDGNIYVKLENRNPAMSVKCRIGSSMVLAAEREGSLQPGMTIVEPTSGNTGIALAMAAAIRGYRIILIMPSHMSDERKRAMSAYGAQLLEISPQQGMEGARDLALQMQARGEGRVLDQFANPDNPRAHRVGTGPEIWRQTSGTITHLVSSMGTTGTTAIRGPCPCVPRASSTASRKPSPNSRAYSSSITSSMP